MKAMIALMLTAVFTIAMVPAQAATVSANTGIITQTLSMGDGVDSRHCMLMKKRGMKAPGYCRP
ncbi:hypothetical protein [Oceanisphaera sediminis]|uniref:Uncharacterized protein n=1 Tax=Oceanisphaera sediminis TaxID=981381 RepID=A0ABP7E436_9GAMM|nr:hypothetical protein [uncultured Oceanisphaera sp.]